MIYCLYIHKNNTHTSYDEKGSQYHYFFSIFSLKWFCVQVPKYIKKPILDSNEKYEK